MMRSFQSRSLTTDLRPTTTSAWRRNSASTIQAPVGTRQGTGARGMRAQMRNDDATPCKHSEDISSTLDPLIDETQAQESKK